MNAGGDSTSQDEAMEEAVEKQATGAGEHLSIDWTRLDIRLLVYIIYIHKDMYIWIYIYTYICRYVYY